VSAHAITGKPRELLYLSTPSLWPQWPLLPLVRRTRGEEEMGLLCDVMGICGRTGYSATVFLCNMFEAPGTLDEFLMLPREAYDLPEEVHSAGWRVD
jgi:hypothetical protein